MLLLHLRHAVYVFYRHRAYSVLNMLGLSLAMGCCLVLYWYIRFHRSFDTYHQQASRTVRLVTENHQGGLNFVPGIPTPIGPALRQDMPWLKQVAMSIGQDNRLIRVMDTAGRQGPKFMEERAVAFVEPAYFKILDYQWLHGRPDSSLRLPFTAVLTQRLAKKYFGTQNPIGRCLRMNNRLDLTITGLIDDIPDNTDLRYELFISYATLNFFTHNGTGLNQWDGFNWQTYCWVVLPKAEDTTRLARALPDFHRRHHAPSLQTYIYRILPLPEQHTSTRYNGAIDPATLQTLTWIGLLLILTACVNFINMATSQAFRRGREIGVRRVIGATRRRIFWQFMVETALLTTLSAGTGIVIAYTLLPFLRTWTETPVPFLLDLSGWLFLLGLVILITLLAGTYPGWILAGFRPSRVLKSQPSDTATGGLMLRRILVSGQLALSMGFVVAITVMVDQLTLWFTASPGLTTENRLFIPMRRPLQTDLPRFKKELSQLPEVTDVSFSFSSPLNGEINTYYVRYDKRTKEEPFQMMIQEVDHRFIPLYNIQLLAGRNLTPGDSTSAIVLNEKAVRMLGLRSPADAIGKRLLIPYPNNPVSGPIVGVVRNWQHSGFKNDVLPIALFSQRASYLTCNLALKANYSEQTTQAIRQIWERYFPNELYDTTPLTTIQTSYYQSERQQLQLIRLAAGVTIAIVCVGLYGLVAFLTNRRAREVAVRKTLGARTDQLVWLFAREFIWLLGIAFLVAAPVSAWLMIGWLDQYTYRVSLTPTVFVLSFLTTSLVTLITIGYQTLKAAFTNPAQALRSD